MKITIFGTWYVGLVTGTCLAEVWHEVMCIDIDQTKVDNLKTGIIPIYEPWLEELVKRNYKESRLHFSTDAKMWVEFATAIFSAVWTPPDKNHRADLQYVKAVAETVWKNMQDYKVFINKSTVPVWTGDICKEIIEKELEKRNKIGHPQGVPVLNSSRGESCVHPIKKEKCRDTPCGCHDISFDIVSNPEFLKEWVAVRDFMLPDRIVCGVESEKAKQIMQEIYKPFVRTNRPLVFTDIKSAEIIKYAANAFLATKISFINEIANFSELAWANISEISKWIGLDERIGSRFLHAWIGYGWSCFPKDVQALIETWKDFGYDFDIIKSVEKVNEKQKLKVVEKLLKRFDTPMPLTGTSPLQEEENIKNLKWKTIAIWWLAFKPKTDDIRDAPSLAVIDKLLELWAEKIQAFDPVAMDNVERYYNSPLSTPQGALSWTSSIHLDFPPEGERIAQDKLVLFENNYKVLDWADALIILTEWDEFRMVDFEKIKKLMRGNIIIDGRNIWNKSEVEWYWFEYEGIGK